MRIKQYIQIGVLVVLTTITTNTFGQQDPMYTQYMYNIATVNPAANGIDDLTRFVSVTRFQFAGVEGAPTTQSLSADIPFKSFNSGVGVSYFYDQLGPERSHNTYIDYSYHINITPKIKLGMGLKAGFKVYSADFAGLGADEVPDDVFMSNVYGDVLPNLGLGIMVYNNKFYGGISAPKLINHLNEGADNASGNEERHYFIVGGYNYQINRDFGLKSSAFIRMVEAVNPSLDLSVRTVYRNFLIGGLAFRTGDAISIMFQVEAYENLFVGYAYDISINKLRAGSHEILLSYRTNVFNRRSNGKSKFDTN